MKNIKTFEQFNHDIDTNELLDEGFKEFFDDAFDQIKAFFKGKTSEEELAETMYDIKHHYAKRMAYVAAVKRKDGSDKKYIEYWLNNKNKIGYPKWDPIAKEWVETGIKKSYIDYGDN